MACTNNKFVINKDLTNEFQITIKQQGTTLPMEIDGSDTFEATLYLLKDNSVVGTIDMTDGPNGQISVVDANSGVIKLVFKDTLVSTLVSERGSKVDDYYLKPTYRIAIDATTVNNGNFVAKLPEAFVE